MMAYSLLVVGSPPHMRGKVIDVCSVVDKRRITPAHAGKSSLATASAPLRKDHPRTCGEKSGCCLRFRPRPGITPAHAGKSLSWFCACGNGRDHPRICREKRREEVPEQANTGSPPHMRGKEKTGALPTAVKRITPAHAGKRSALIASFIASKDHPRTCGEKIDGFSFPKPGLGSPPHMRGKVSPGSYC